MVVTIVPTTLAKINDSSFTPCHSERSEESLGS